MSNSNLVSYTKLSPHYSKRTGKISKITIHHAAAVASVEALGNVFQSKEASANYGIGSDARVALYVDEAHRSWASSNATNDNVAVTIEVSNSASGGQWPVSDTVLKKLIELCADICKRNGIEELKYTGKADGNLTMHKMFAATACPGPYLESKMPYIAAEVNKILNTKEEKTMTFDEEFERAKALGITDGSNPQNNATRKQTAVMIYRGIKLVLKLLGSDKEV